METLTIRIQNPKTLKLLKDLEALSLLEIIREKRQPKKEGFAKSREDDGSVVSLAVQQLTSATDDGDDYSSIAVVEQNPIYKG